MQWGGRAFASIRKQILVRIESNTVQIPQILFMGSGALKTDKETDLKPIRPNSGPIDLSSKIPVGFIRTRLWPHISVLSERKEKLEKFQ